MMDFGRWFAQQPHIPEMPATATPAEVELPEGFDEMEDGSILVNCCRCEASITISDHLTRAEIALQDPGDQYCGGGPGCTP